MKDKYNVLIIKCNYKLISHHMTSNYQLKSLTVYGFHVLYLIIFQTTWCYRHLFIFNLQPCLRS